MIRPSSHRKHKENKLQSYLLKSINVNFTPEEIHEELNKLETSEIQFVRVQHFSTKLSRSNNKVFPILLVKLSPDNQPTRLRSIKFVAYQTVHWEKLEKKTETTQCRRCQRLGHTAANCNMNFRCIKCKDNHPPSQCSVPKGEKIEKEKVYCIDCNCYGHPASFRGCPKIVQYKQQFKDKVLKQKDLREAKVRALNNFVRPNIDFATLTRGTQSKKAPTYSNHTLINCSPPPAKNSNTFKDSSPPWTIAMEVTRKTICESFSQQINLLMQGIRKNSVRIDAICTALQLNTQ